MRISILTALFSLVSFIAFGQGKYAPLTSNPTVVKKYQKKFPKLKETSIDRSITAVCGINPLEFDSGGPVYVISGESVEICLRQFSFDLLDSIACQNCGDLNLTTGTSIDQENYCITYAANSGIEYDNSDTLRLEIFEASGNSILEFPMEIRRPAQRIPQPLQIVKGDSAHQICLPNLNLPGSNLSFTDLASNDPRLGILYELDECYTYLPRRFAEENTVDILVCDDLCVCDTVAYTFQSIKNTINISTDPFFDDFSYEGPYPNADLWLDDRVFVNNTLAHKPPSIGVATFDGISERGTSYGGYGPADFLTSNYIDASNFNANSDVYLSFFACPKGNGYYPVNGKKY